MRALKILDQGGVGRFSDLRWPLPANGEPGAWVDAGGDPGACVRGIHAAALDDLPFWLGPELYVIELSGVITRHENKLVAERGRLLHRVDAWNADVRRAFAEAAALQARDAAAAILRDEGEPALADRLAAITTLPALAEALAAAPPCHDRAGLSLGYLRDAVTFAPIAPLGAAYAAAHAGLDTVAYAEARAFHARWLADALRLREALTA